MASFRVPTLLIWLSAAGIASGSFYHIYSNSGLPLTPQGILSLVGYVPKFTKEEAAESYLRSVCPTNKKLEELRVNLFSSSMDKLPGQPLKQLADKSYQANADAINALTSSDKRWPDDIRLPIRDLIQEIRLENDLLYRYQNYTGSASQITNRDFRTKIEEIHDRFNPSPSTLIRMRLGILGVPC